MSPTKTPTPVLGVPVSASSAPNDSGEMEALQAAEDVMRAYAAVATEPVPFQIQDIFRRLADGAWAGARRRWKDANRDERVAAIAADLEGLRNEIMPRATPARLMRAAWWIILAAISVVGWFVAFDRFAKVTDLEKLEDRVRQNERQLDRMTAPPRAP